MARLERVVPPAQLLLEGPTVRARVGASPDLALLTSQVVPEPQEALAIVDPGTPNTWVDRRLLNRLRLKFQDERAVPWPEGGTLIVATYQVGVELIFDDEPWARPFVMVNSAELAGHVHEVSIDSSFEGSGQWEHMEG